MSDLCPEPDYRISRDLILAHFRQLFSALVRSLSHLRLDLAAELLSSFREAYEQSLGLIELGNDLTHALVVRGLQSSLQLLPLIPDNADALGHVLKLLLHPLGGICGDLKAAKILLDLLRDLIHCLLHSSTGLLHSLFGLIHGLTDRIVNGFRQLVQRLRCCLFHSLAKLLSRLHHGLPDLVKLLLHLAANDQFKGNGSGCILACHTLTSYPNILANSFSKLRACCSGAPPSR